MYDLWLVTHFLGLALAVGTGFAMLTLGLATADMPPADRGAFMRRAFALSRNGSVGLLLLIVSGVGLTLTLGLDVVMAIGMFHVKLTLIVILIGVFGYMQVQMRKAKSGDAAAMARIPMIGRIMLLLGIGIVTVAVLAFH